jgi:hypothetical protein
MTYTQFRLSNGDEIVAQVVQEPSNDEDMYIVVRNAMMVVRSENIKEGFRYYSFRPWMSFQLNEEYFQLLNYNHIIGEAKPDKLLLEQYYRAIASEQDDEKLSADSDGAEIKQMRRMIANLRAVTNESTEYDSDTGDNVISLFDKGKLH